MYLFFIMFCLICEKEAWKFQRMSDEDEQFAVRAITDCKYYPELDQFRWYVEWEPADSQEIPSETFEPLEGLLACPLLVLEYERDLWKTLPESVKNERKKVPIQEFLQASGDEMKDKFMETEFIPTGKEVVLKIYSSWNHKVKKKKNVAKKVDVQYFMVKFYSDENYRIVRRPYMEYYFPTPVMEFLKKIEG